MRALSLHLAGSAVIAFVAWWLVFSLWYPAPLSSISGGAKLFTLLIAIDLVLGPALTAVVANPRKTRGHLVRDICLIVAIQIGALVYGLHAIAVARPVALAFEIDLFRLVSATEIEADQLDLAPPALQRLSWRGPITLAAIKPTDSKEQFDTIQLGLAGIHLAALPRYWRNYDDHSGLAWQRAIPIAKVMNYQPNLKPEIDKLASRAQIDAATLRALPLLARRVEGMVLLAPGGRVVGILAATAPP